ncbi:PTS system beta-glucoside-specific EIIBCA component [compost metagenome]
MDQRQLAKEILHRIGGKENVRHVTHCVTRLRFQLKDNQLPATEDIKKLEGVLTVVQQGGQYQVVIGNKVTSVYKELSGLIGNLDALAEEVGEESPKSLFARFTSMISGVFMPVMGALAASGMIKGLLAILTVLGVLVETDGTYVVLHAIGDALFYFFPVILSSSAAKYFKLNPYVGMIIGAAMIYPSLLAAADAGSPLSFMGIPLNMMNYTSSVFPAIVAVWVASRLNVYVEKIVPQGFRYFLAPCIVVLITVPLTLFLVGPVISFLSNQLAQLTTAIYSFNPTIAGLVLGGPWILIVMFGLHWAFIPIFINNMATQGFDSIMGLLAANQFAMAGAAIAFGLRAKDKKLRSLGISTGGTTLLGVSEPALYGVLLPHKKPLIMAIIGGSIGGTIGGLFQSKVYAFMASGIFGIPGAINSKEIDAGFYGYVLQMAVGLIVGFILTYYWGYQTKESTASAKRSAPVTAKAERASIPDPAATTQSANTGVLEVYSPLNGELVDWSQVEDEAFASGAMGPGVAIEPDNGVVVSPVQGVIMTVTPSRHAISIVSTKGLEILIHVGINTVKLKGKGFEPKVSEGQEIQVGDPLLVFDPGQIREAGYAATTMVIITNAADYQSVKPIQSQQTIQAAAPIIRVERLRD